MSSPMKHIATLVALLAVCGAVDPAFAAPAGAPHAAACVAALEAREAGLAGSVKAGSPAATELLDVVRSGIAIIGTQYLGGLGEREARGLLSAAEQDFGALPPATAQLRQRDCLREGRALYDHASSIERSLITSVAQRRIKRLTKAS